LPASPVTSTIWPRPPLGTFRRLRVSGYVERAEQVAAALGIAAS